MVKNKKRSLYDIYSDKALNGPIWVVGGLWVTVPVAYSLEIGPKGLLAAGAGVVSLVLMYHVRNQAARFGGVVAMVAVTAGVILSGQSTAGQEPLAPQPQSQAADAVAYTALQSQGFAIKSVTLTSPTSGEAELKEPLPGTLTYPLIVLKKEDDHWYVGCNTVEGPVLWLRDSDDLRRDYTRWDRCPAGLSVSNYNR